MKKVFMAVALVVLMMASVSAQAELVSNGGFETYGSSMGNGLYNVPSWTVVDSSNGTGIFKVDPNWGSFGLAPKTGEAFLWGGAYNSNIASVSQTLTTAVGQNYNLDFWLANSGGTPNSFSVNWNGTTLNSMLNAGASVMTKYAYVVAGTGSDTLNFTFNQEPGVWALDDVRVTATPIPAAIWLLGSGLVGLFGVRKRFRSMS